MSYKNDIINYIKSRGSRENPVLSHEIEDKFKTHGTTVRKTISPIIPRRIYKSLKV